MAGDDRFVSPYLLRPVRTLERVLGGRSRAVESASERVEGRQARDRQDALRVGGWRASACPTLDETELP
jgi:hypothetical protein